MCSIGKSSSIQYCGDQFHCHHHRGHWWQTSLRSETISSSPKYSGGIFVPNSFRCSVELDWSYMSSISNGYAVHTPGISLFLLNSFLFLLSSTRTISFLISFTIKRVKSSNCSRHTLTYLYIRGSVDCGSDGVFLEIIILPHMCFANETNYSHSVPLHSVPLWYVCLGFTIL